MSKVIITYEFDSIEDKSEMNDLMKVHEYVSTLFEIDDQIRTKLKYGDDEWIGGACEFLEDIRKSICDSGAMHD